MCTVIFIECERVKLRSQYVTAEVWPIVSVSSLEMNQYLLVKHGALSIVGEARLI